MTRPIGTPSIFRPGATFELEFTDYSQGYIDSVPDINAPDNSITGGRNFEINIAGKPKKRTGITLFGNFIGETTGILGGFNFVNRGGTQEQLVVYNTGIYRYVTGIWTLLTGGATLTTNLKSDGAYLPLTNKFYITNGTDDVQVYTSGSSIASDSSFKKGKYIIHFQNRLLTTGVANQEDYVWYTDLGVDTFGANNYFRVEGAPTGLIEYYDKVLIFTKKKINRLQNFAFDGAIAGPEAVIALPVDFGAIYDRTIVLVNNFVYFLGQDSRKKVELYKCDGYKAVPVGDARIRTFLNSLSSAQLESACAVADGAHYRLEVAESGQTTNTLGILYDTNRGIYYTPESRFVTGRADFTCLWTSETNGQWEIYAGSAGTGQVYKIDSTVDYDELAEERYLTRGTYNVAIDANPVKRAAQSFKLHNYNTSDLVYLNKVTLLMKKNAGTTTNLTVRIETDNNGKPTGTAVTGGTATLAAFTDSSYVWKTVSFTSPPQLIGNTSYWIVVQHVTEGSGNSQYLWLGDACSPTYVYGNLATYGTTNASSTDTITPSAGAVAGRIVGGSGTRAGGTWDEAHDGDGSKSTEGDLAVQIKAGTNTNKWELIRRSILNFDTSMIPDGATITSAQLSLYPTVETETGAFSNNIALMAATPDSTTSLNGTDYAFSGFGTTRFIDSDIDGATLTLNSYNTFSLNAAGIAAINKTGVTKFGLLLEQDFEDTEPTWSSDADINIEFQGYNNTNPPRLIISYAFTNIAAWQGDVITDQAFQLYCQSPIDGYFDSKALLPAGLGKRYKLHRFLSLFSSTGDYNVQIGFSKGEFNSFKNFLVSLSSGANSSEVWGGGGTWGSGLIWGGTLTKVFNWTGVSGFMGRILKYRVRNNRANQPVVFDGIHLILTILRRLR